jgi:hypothetical protein
MWNLSNIATQLSRTLQPLRNMSVLLRGSDEASASAVLEQAPALEQQTATVHPLFLCAR